MKCDTCGRIIYDGRFREDYPYNLKVGYFCDRKCLLAYPKKIEKSRRKGDE